MASATSGRGRPIAERLRDLLVAPEFGRELGRLVLSRCDPSAQMSNTTLLVMGLLLLHIGEGIIGEVRRRES